MWDVTLLAFLYDVLGSVLALLMGFMLGLLIRSTNGAMAAFLVYTVLLPVVFGLAATQDGWFRSVQPWIDRQDAERALFLVHGPFTGAQWAHLGVTSVIWLIVPLLAVLRLVNRSEIK